MTTMTTKITKIKFENVKQIYSGQDQVCRCGCKGKYFEPGTVGFTMGVNKMRKMLCEGTAKVEAECNYVNVSFGNGRALTAYFDY